ncbi:LPXTG cell wall anchor domain-containing protein [Luedemannella helvata]|uniref:LPXTG cell wall anchor domain-containing protein n=1 Tax=Luedemannella helvata TaxID=349315 RepID=A0ABP4X8N9_9ACTN
MASAWRARFMTAVGTAGLVVFGFASPASADSVTISINPGNIAPGGTSASTFGDQSCDANQGGGPYAGQDVWVFNLPSSGSAAEKSRFESITATFDTGAGTVTKTIPPDGTIVFIGTSMGFVTTPAGWKLTAATAVVTKPEPQFVLTHTCPAGTPTTAPATTTPAPTKPAATTVPPTTATATTPVPDSSEPGTTDAPPTSGAPTTGVAPATPGPSTSPASGGLPVTGSSLGVLLAVGAGMVAAGAALLLARKRRDTGTAA